MGRFLDDPAPASTVAAAPQTYKGRFLDDGPQEEQRVPQSPAQRFLDAHKALLNFSPAYQVYKGYSALKEPLIDLAVHASPIPAFFNAAGDRPIPYKTINPMSALAPVPFNTMVPPEEGITSGKKIGREIASAGIDALAGTALTEGGPAIFKAMKKTPDFFKYGTTDLSAENLTNKATKLTTEILQPSKTELANSLSRGREMQAVTQASENMKQAKSYTDLRLHLDDVIKKTMEERNGLLKQIDTSNGNATIGSGYISKLEKYIADQEAKHLATPTELRQMRQVLESEKMYFSKNPITRYSGQLRKEDLQALTDTLLQRDAKGLVTDTQPARNKALDQLREGLKEAVEGDFGKIKSLNSKYGGLKRAKELIAGQEALSRKALPENPIQKIGRLVFHPKDIPAAVGEGALDRQNSLLNKTKKVSDLMQRAKN